MKKTYKFALAFTLNPRLAVGAVAGRKAQVTASQNVTAPFTRRHTLDSSHIDGLFGHVPGREAYPPGGAQHGGLLREPPQARPTKLGTQALPGAADEAQAQAQAKNTAQLLAAVKLYCPFIATAPPAPLLNTSAAPAATLGGLVSAPSPGAKKRAREGSWSARFLTPF